jgi:type VI secretion system protein VasJ
MSSEGDWEILRQETEKAMQEPGFQFWLDLQQVAHGALVSSGPAFRQAADAVVDETMQLLGRAPGLVDLSFNDGTPFVSFETREWLDEHSSSSDESSGTAKETDDETKEVVRNAATLAADGKLNEALTTLSHAAGSARSGAKRFTYELAKARLLRKSGNDQLARNVLSELNERIVRSEIDEWDPDTAVELWTEMIAAFGKLASKKGPQAEFAKQTIDDVMAKLTRIDVNAALKLS